MSLLSLPHFPKARADNGRNALTPQRRPIFGRDRAPWAKVGIRNIRSPIAASRGRTNLVGTPEIERVGAFDCDRVAFRIKRDPL
ncbi:MAG: hypothetical protein QF902_09485 [Rhodospirillales bacterium]|nr:hypothetical protein [Rhodospirillales bacterium]